MVGLREILKQVLPVWIQEELGAVRTRLTNPPVLGATPWGGPDDSPLTFLMVCRTGFDVRVPNANATIRLGFCHGFAQAGVRYRLVSVYELERAIAESSRPFACLSCFDYLDLSRAARRKLRTIPHFVWVYPWFPRLPEVYAANHLPDVRVSPRVTRQILDSGASFVFGSVPPSALEFFSTWSEHGQRLEAIPLACDTDRYQPVEPDPRFSGVEMAFVGGFRPYKNFQYEKYLRPYEDRLRVYGYDRWPYRHYGGLLGDEDEKYLYRTAKVCPALSEPHAEVMGDIVERVFKIMGSGGLAVTDAVRFYADLFAEDELLVPRDVAHYHELARAALEDEALNARLRKKGLAAIQGRHTYAHRARRILSLLGMERFARPEAPAA